MLIVPLPSSVVQCHILLEHSVYGGMLMLIACKLSDTKNWDSLFSEDLFVLSKYRKQFMIVIEKCIPEKKKKSAVQKSYETYFSC